MKTLTNKLKNVFVFSIALIFTIFLSNCKGHVEIHELIDSVSNCSAPYIVYFKADAEHRSKDLEYTWDFGDGTTSHDLEPMHIYEKDGIYQVNLHIKQNKVDDSKTIPLYLTDDSTRTISDWDYTINTEKLWAPAKVQFQNYSKYATSYLWVFDDGDSSRLIEPEHVYETPGTYRLQLKAMCNGDTSINSYDMIVKDPPNQILIDKVTTWMPNSVIGNDLMVEIWYAGHREFRSSWISGVESFPVTFNVQEKLFWFNGDYNTNLLEFMVFVNVDDVPVIRFYTRSDNLLDDFYPYVLSFDDGYGRALDAKISYKD